MKVIKPHWLPTPAKSWEIKSKPASDASGVERGARGFAELDKTDRDYLSAEFDRRRQVGTLAVGQVGQVGDGDKLKQRFNAQLEGDE